MNAKTLNQFAVYACGTLVHPGATFEKLLSEPRRIAYGSAAIMFVGALYTIVSFVGYLNGFGPCVQPFLPIPVKEYYFYQTFFTILVFWLTTLIFAAVVQFFSSFFGGEGKFEDCVAVFGFSFHITMIPLMWIPEAIMVTFNLHSPANELCGTTTLGPIADNIRMAAAALWPIVVTFIGLKKVQRFSWLKVLVIGLVGVILYEAVFWTYIR